MNDKLLEAIREVLLLDSARTQGDWHRAPKIGSGYGYAIDTTEAVRHARSYDKYRIGNVQMYSDQADANADFIAQAPQMASLLRQCMERMEADKVQEAEPNRCTEEDGCPTETAVLKRFWREHQ